MRAGKRTICDIHLQACNS